MLRADSQIQAQIDQLSVMNGHLAEGALLALHWLLRDGVLPPAEACSLETTTGRRVPTAAEEAAADLEPQSDDISAERQGDLFEHFGADREGPAPSD